MSLQYGDLEDENQTTNLLVQNSSSPGKPTQKKKYSGNNRPIQAFELHTSPYKKDVSYSMSNQFNSNIVTGNSAPQAALSNTLPSRTKQEIFQSNQTSAQAYQQVTSNVGNLLGPNKQRRLHSAKATRQQSSSKSRPYSAKPITQQVPLLAHSSQFLAQNSPSIQQQPTGGTSPIKSQFINRKNIAKLVPASPKQSKEELYTIALQSKIENNALKDENIRLQTRLNFIEQRLSQQDQSGNIAMLLKQLNACKQRCSALSHDLRSQQQLLKSTVITEIKTENEMYKNELIRLRALLESGLGGGLRVMIKKREQMSQEVKSKEPESNFIKFKKVNQDQQKQISQLQHQLTQFECYHQQDLNILKQELTCKFASDEQQLRLQHHQEITNLKAQFQSEIDNMAVQNYQQMTEHNQRYDNLQKQHENFKIITQNENNQLSELQDQLYEQDEYINLTLQNHQSEMGQKEQIIIEMQQELADREEKHFQLMFKNVELKELCEKFTIQNCQNVQDVSDLEEKLEKMEEKYFQLLFKNADLKKICDQQGNQSEKDVLIADLISQLADKEQKHFELLFKHVDLKNLCEELNSQVDAQKNGITTSDDLQNLKQEIKDLKSELELKEEKHYQLLFKNVDLKNLCEQLQCQIEELRQNVSQPNQYKEILELTQQLTEKEERHYLLLFKNVDLKNLCEDLQKQLKELKSDATSSTDDSHVRREITDLKQELAEKEDKHYQLLLKNVDLKNFCEELQKQLQELKPSATSSVDDSDLRQEITELKQELAEKEDKHYQLLFKNVDLKNFCEELQKQLWELKPSATSSVDDSDLRQEITDLKQELAEKEDKHYQLLFKNVDLKNLCEELQKQLQELKPRATSSADDSDLRQEIELLKQELVEKEDKHYQLLFKNVDLKNLCDQLSQQVQKLQSSVDASVNDQDFKQEIADLKNECAEIADKNYQLLYEKVDLKNLCDKLSEELGALRQNEKLSTYDQDLKQEVANLTQQLADKEEKHYQLLFKNVDLKNLCEQLTLQVQELNNFTVSKPKIQDTSQKCEQCHIECNFSPFTNNQISELTQKLTENEEKNQQLLLKNVDLKNLLDQQQTQEEMLRNLCEELSLKVEELQKKLVCKEDNFQEQQQQVQVLHSGTFQQANEQDLKQEIADLKNECSEIAEKNYQLVYEKLDLKNLCEDLSRELNELKQGSSSQADSDLKLQIQVLTQQLAEKEEKHYQLLFKNVDLKNLCEQQSQEIKDIQTSPDSQQLEEKYYKLLFQNADLKTLNDDLSRKLTDVEVELIQSKAIISNLEHLRDDLKRKNDPSNIQKAQTLGVKHSKPVLAPQLDGLFERASESSLKQPFVLTSTDEFNQYDVNKQQSIHEQSDAITAEHSEIKECLYQLKRACQTNYIRFDQIENFIFGDDYRPELRITMAELANKFKSILKLEQSKSGVFSRYLVEQGMSKKEGTQISQDSKVLQCRVVTTLIQNLNMNCEGLQVYSKQKERKMKLIVGQVLAGTDSLKFESFEFLAQKLAGGGISSETLDCALVYLLRMSDSLSEVTQPALNKFISNCKKEANSHSMTGMSFPLQDELLEYSITDDDQDEILGEEAEVSEEDLELNDRQEATPVQSPNQLQKSKHSLSQSFDSGREEETPIFRQDNEGSLPHHNVEREDSNSFDSGRDDDFEQDQNFVQEFDRQENQQHEIGTSPMPVRLKLNQESNSEFSVHDDDDEEFKEIQRQQFRMSQEHSSKQKQSQSNQAYSNYSSSEVLAEPMSFNQPTQNLSGNSDDLIEMQAKPGFVEKQSKSKPNEDDEAYIIKSQNRLVGLTEKVQKLNDSVNDFVKGEDDIQEDIIEGDFVSESYSDEDRVQVRQ